jgi:hypothetical protein
MRDMEQYLKNLLNISMNLELKQKKNKVMIKIPKSLVALIMEGMNNGWVNITQEQIDKSKWNK